MPKITRFVELTESLGKTSETFSLFLDIADKNPNNYWVRTELAWHYLTHNEPLTAEDILNKIKQDSPNNAIYAFDMIGKRYKSIGDYNKSKIMFDRAFEIKRSIYGITQENFLELYNITKSRGIRLVIMQYPTLDVYELENIFRGDENITFISNQENFKDALDKYPDDEIFVDHFAVSWGHSTKKGNQLIAENVANEVLKVANS